MSPGTQVLMTGYLNKQGNRIKVRFRTVEQTQLAPCVADMTSCPLSLWLASQTWKRRYVVLDSEALHYYVDREAMTAVRRAGLL